MIKAGTRKWSGALAAGILQMSSSALAQTNVEGDPHRDDPAGIVTHPCPDHPLPSDEPGWHRWNLHMLTRDFGQLCRYAAANAQLKQLPRVVFIGDSITDNWINLDPSLFTDGIIDRGISGQTTPQMLVRFRQDVIALRPRAVHIMAGTNDIAGNTGAATFETVTGNIESMVDLARAHGIAVILGSVPPAGAFPWSPSKRPAPQIAQLNSWLRSYARRNGLIYADYHSPMAQPDGAMKPGLSSDGVHPTKQGYASMRAAAEAAIARALRTGR